MHDKFVIPHIPHLHADLNCIELEKKNKMTKKGKVESDKLNFCHTDGTQNLEELTIDQCHNSESNQFQSTIDFEHRVIQFTVPNCRYKRKPDS